MPDEPPIHAPRRFGADGTFRVTGDRYLTLEHAATVDRDDATAVTLGSRSLLDFRWSGACRAALSSTSTART
jgi:hypothetical protein